jgi:hypothetical protein
MTENPFYADELGRLIERWVSSGMRARDVTKQPESEGARAFREILALDGHGLLDALRRVSRVLADAHKELYSGAYSSVANKRALAAGDLFTAISRRKVPLGPADVIHILENTTRMSRLNARNAPLKSVLTVCERGLEGTSPEGVLEHLLKELKRKLEDTDFAEERSLAARIDRLLESEVAAVIVEHDIWARTALDRLAEMPQGHRARWQSLLAHAASATAARPSRKWMSEAAERVQAIGREAFAAEVIPWFRLVGSRGTGPKGKFSYDARELLQGRNAEVLRGLACCCTGSDNPALATALGDMGAACYRHVRGHGRRSVGVGNACAAALATMPGTEPISQLSRLRHMVKMPNVERLIDRDLERLAESAGLTTAELEDLAVPTLGMETVGELRRAMGQYTAVVRVTGTSSTELRWIGPDGGETKTVPAAAKRDFKQEIAEVRRSTKEISTQLLTQRGRLEGCYLETPRQWAFDTWCERLLDQPLMGVLARRLIWRFDGPGGETAAGAWNGNGVVDVNDRPIDWFGAGTVVRLWHPIDREAEEVSRWKRWIEKHAVQQPFKQAHREVYAAGADDGANAFQSDRFANEVIRQHQMVRIARGRGWRAENHGIGDLNPMPVLPLPHWGLRAELAVEGIHQNHHDVTSSRQFLAVSTGPLRFFDDDGVALPLAQVPPLVFSEVMRHLDLFVSVCSVANDPEESDEDFQAYFLSFPEGRQRASEAIRRELLEDLVPRLEIASRCRFTDRFLEVQGPRESYRIHLGSGMVLLGPEWRFLRFESDKEATTAANKVLRGWTPPFEDEHVVPLIIGRALVLANDPGSRPEEP